MVVLQWRQLCRKNDLSLSCALERLRSDGGHAPSDPSLHPLRSEEGCSIGVVHDGFHIVTGEETRGPVHHSLKPAVVVLLDHVDDGALLEGQLVFFVAGVVVNGHH